MLTRKKPLIALALSLVVPGLGQLYNGERTKGLVLAGTCLALGGGSWWFSGLTRVSVVLALVLVWVSAVLDAYKTAKAVGQPVDWYYRTSYVVAMVLLVGPLALPLLWRSPHFSRFAQWAWTTVIMATVCLFLATPYVLGWLVKQSPELVAVLQQAGIHL